jgi:hypothetical protein
MRLGGRRLPAQPLLRVAQSLAELWLAAVPSAVIRCVLSVCDAAIIESFPPRPNGQRCNSYIGCARSPINVPSRARLLARQALQQPSPTQTPASNRFLFGPTPLELMRRITFVFGRS